jgi:hypothetical protein
VSQEETIARFLGRSVSTWRKLSETRWYGRGWGTVSRRADGWWGSNSVSAEVDVDPVVGPFPTAKAARYALVEAHLAARRAT